MNSLYVIDSLDWLLQLNNFDLCRHHQLIKQYVHVHTAHTHRYTHTCVFSSPVMSKPNGVHMCLHLTQIAIIWQFSTVLIGFCHYCYIAQSNCTQIVQMRRPVLNTSLHIVHFLYGFLSGLLKLFLICNVLMFILKMQKNDMMICCFFWSAAQLNYPGERKNI